MDGQFRNNIVFRKTAMMTLHAVAMVLISCIIGSQAPRAESSAPSNRFPLQVSENHKYLKSSDGEPFLIHGDTAWSLIGDLNREEAELYLEDRQKRGFNTLIVSLIERRFSRNAPRNAYGQDPFLSWGNFSEPNDQYFDEAEWILRRAYERGFLVLLAPVYAGFGGGEQGWMREMIAAGSSALEVYGQYLGKRFQNLPNIIWVLGGDHDVSDKSLVRAIVKGIQSAGRTSLMTAHSAPDTIPSAYWKGEDWLKIDTVYTYGDVYQQVLERYRQSRSKPILMLESAYEGEHRSTEQSLRTAAYGSLLAGAAGHMFGNNPIWHFSGPGIYQSDMTWQQALSSRGAESMTHLKNFLDHLRWWELEPDDSNSPVDVEGPGRALSASSPDGSFRVIYVMGASAVVLKSQNTNDSASEVQWFDPSTGEYSASQKVGTSRRLVLEVPAAQNGMQFDDWVVIIRSYR
jgi:hypothetical protein